jgi:hypothetical protein
LRLSELYYEDEVQPILARQFPGLSYSAGLIGAGSDVVGYDTARSMDHDWGPRLTIWLTDEAFDTHHDELSTALARSLPGTYQGFPTSVGRHADGTLHMAHEESDEPRQHFITISTVRRWFGGIADPGVDTSDWVRLPLEWLDEVSNPQPTGSGPATLDPATWITLSEQWLLETTSGRIFRDDSGAITRIREALAWYPDDIWRYRMAAQWMRIDQLEPFIGRCGEVEDDLGSQLVAMSLVRDAMRLAFLLERRYAPYPKWFGTGFARLTLATELTPHLDAARFAKTWQDRERGVVDALVLLANRHNEMSLTDWIDPTPRPFHTRPFTVLGSARFSEALAATIGDARVLALPRNLGGIDQYMDSTDALGNGALHRAVRRWLEPA